MNYLTGLFESAALKLIGIGSVIALLVHAARHVIEQRHGSWAAWFRGLVAAILTGVLVSLLMDAVDLPHTVEMAIIAIAVYVADDVLLAVRSMGSMLGTDPMGTVRRFIDGLRGGRGN